MPLTNQAADQASRRGTGFAGPLADGPRRGRLGRLQASNSPQGLLLVQFAPLGG